MTWLLDQCGEERPQPHQEVLMEYEDIYDEIIVEAIADNISTYH